MPQPFLLRYPYWLSSSPASISKVDPTADWREEGCQIASICPPLRLKIPGAFTISRLPLGVFVLKKQAVTKS
jgi:hypothetical protein